MDLSLFECPDHEKHQPLPVYISVSSEHPGTDQNPYKSLSSASNKTNNSSKSSLSNQSTKSSSLQQPRVSYEPSVTCICISPNGSYLAIGYSDGHVMIWDVHANAESRLWKLFVNDKSEDEDGNHNTNRNSSSSTSSNTAEYGDEYMLFNKSFPNYAKLQSIPKSTSSHSIESRMTDESIIWISWIHMEYIIVTTMTMVFELNLKVEGYRVLFKTRLNERLRMTVPHPRRKGLFLLCSESSEGNDSDKNFSIWPSIVDMSSSKKIGDWLDQYQRISLNPSVASDTTTSSSTGASDSENGQEQEKRNQNISATKISTAFDTPKQKGDMKEAQFIRAIFSKTGEFVFVGGNHGRVYVFNSINGQLIQACHSHAYTKGFVKGLYLSPDGRYLVSRSGGRYMQSYRVDVEAEKKRCKAENKLPDNASLDMIMSLVHRRLNEYEKLIEQEKNSKLMITESENQADVLKIRGHSSADIIEPHRTLSDSAEQENNWSEICYCANGKFILASSDQASSQKICLWNIEDGTHLGGFIGIRSSNAAVHQFAVHPSRAIVFAYAKSGLVHVWGKHYEEGWAAFAPNFKEIKENEEYVEKETEFDQNEYLGFFEMRKGAELDAVDVCAMDSTTEQDQDADIDDEYKDDADDAMEIDGDISDEERKARVRRIKAKKSTGFFLPLRVEDIFEDM